MLGTLIYLFASSLGGQELTPKIRKSLEVLKKSARFESQFYGERAQHSHHHLAFTTLLNDRDKVSHFLKLTKQTENSASQMYGLLGLWRVDQEKYRKVLPTIDLDKNVSCMYTFGPWDVPFETLARSPKKVWERFLFDRPSD